jgi:hypothetical protein
VISDLIHLEEKRATFCQLFTNKENDDKFSFSSEDEAHCSTTSKFNKKLTSLYKKSSTSLLPISPPQDLHHGSTK